MHHNVQLVCIYHTYVLKAIKGKERWPIQCWPKKHSTTSPIAADRYTALHA